MTLQIFPEPHAKTYWEYPRHRQIQDYRLPKKEVITLREALVTRPESLPDESLRGAIYERQGRLVESSRHYRRGKDLLAEVEPESCDEVMNCCGHYLPGRYLYLGRFFDHYGHFLLESLSRCWALAGLECGQDLRYLFHLHSKRDALPGVNLELLSLLGIRRDQIFFATEDCRVEELMIPTQQAVLARAMSMDTIEVYRAIARRVLRENPEPTPDKIYVSRRRLRSGFRKLLNEYLVECAYHSAGYTVVHPQELSLREQVALFARASRVAGVEGSGLHNILFSLEPVQMDVVGTADRIPAVMIQAYLNQWVGGDTTAAIVELQEAAEFIKFPNAGIINFAQRSHLPLTCRKHLEHSSCDAPVDVLKRAYDRDLGELATQIEQRNLEQGMNPDVVLVIQARVALKTGDYETGLVLVGAALQLCPSSPVYIRLQANLLCKLEQFDEAASVFAELHVLQPDNLGFYLQWSLCCLQLERYQQAVTICSNYLQRFPDHSMANFYLGRALASLGDYSGAIESLERAIAGDSKKALYREFIGELYLELGQLERGRDHLDAVMLIQPDNQRVKRLLAGLHN